MNGAPSPRGPSWQTGWLALIPIELCHAFRSLRRSPGFSLAVLLTLGLGIGLNTSIFSVVYGVLLRPLDLPEPQRLVTVSQDMEAVGGRRDASTGRGLFSDWRERSRSFESMAAFIGFPTDLTGGELPESVPGAAVSHEYFSVLGVRPALGRSFRSEEEREGNHLVAILAHGLWQRRFGGDPGILGRTVTINEAAYTVVGILPSGFQEPLVPETELWTPLPLDPPPDDRGHSYVRVIGRLAAGVAPASAQEEMSRIAASLAAEYPDALRGVGVWLSPLADSVVGPTRTMLLLLFGAVSIVLLAACANVANLIMTRMAARRQEVALRTVLGASRTRLVTQLVAEGVLLAAGGAAVGLLLGFGGLELLQGLAPPRTPRLEAVRLDAVVLAYTLVLSAGVGLFAGLVPALRIWRRPPFQVLREAGGAAGGRSAQGLRAALVVAEIALGLVLLIGAGLLVRTLANLSAVDPGFRREGLVLGRTTLAPSRFPDRPEMSNFLVQLEAHLRARTELEAAGLTSNALLAGERAPLGMAIEGDVETSAQSASVPSSDVSPGFFDTVGLAIVAGRPIDERDGPQSPPVVLVNQRFAERYFAGRDALGRRLRIDDPAEPWRTVVGMVTDMRGLAVDRPPQPEIYIPLAQRPARVVTLVGRAAGSPESAHLAIRAAAAAAVPGQVVSRLTTVEAEIARSLSVRRFLAVLIGAFAAVAAVLVAVGTYGVIALAVVQRRREIAVRMALGARAGSVIRMVLLWGGLLTAWGSLIGLAIAAAAGRTLSTYLYGVGPFDPVTATAMTALLALIGLAASVLPALRATRVDPFESLKTDL